ncbi:tRNA pseudouridine synthase A [Entomoplasma ellychniae]|uniref:tRNA pseudouridine synthase A n=1 Tax=Entomoplasma ellychniae TaxID=2114 RepID=A0A8E2UD21_9MOLU|nr:tRNA pseudouridine(38-40) synthase TruA [Entomoplasma ellychniae]PPE04952.1 tRNA pseudouridine synthase A [Entomoplasma ellychniae]
MYRILINLQYDGSSYCGWIKQKNQNSIQGVLEKTIFKVIKSNNFKVYGVSKTDAGVHALSQKVIIEINFQPTLNKFIWALNKALPSDIHISEFDYVSASFELHDVKCKTYVYTLNNSIWDLKNNRYELEWSKNLINIKQLQDICNIFVGEHDFKLFSGLSESEVNSGNFKTIRKIDSIKVFKKADKIEIEFIAKGFIRHQIRYIVQSILNCQYNKVSQSTLKEMLNGNGKKLPFKAEAKGLLLKSVVFNKK